MVGWVVGALILGFAIFIIWRSVRNIAKGKSGCESCGSKDCPHCAAHGREKS